MRTFAKNRNIRMITDFTHFLSSMGIVSKDTTDETISFEYNGLSYLFVSDKNDPYYIRLILPNIENINNADEIDVYKNINWYNNKFKAVKMSVVENSIWLSIEQFLYSRENSNNLFFHMMKGTDMPNRIDLLFSLIYKKHILSGLDEKEWNGQLRKADKDIQDTRKGAIFRFYYDKFEGKQGEELQQEVAEAWKEVMTLFRTLDDWFCTPATCNYIGLLSQCGEDISRLIMHYDRMPDDSTQTDFILYLKERIRFYLRGVKRDDDGNITTPYKDRKNIYRLLLTLNIHLLNIQNDKLESESDVYKFPFDVLNAQDWDIEHIDSFHTNALKKDDLKKEWITTAFEDRKNYLSEEEKTTIESKMENKDYDSVIDLLKKNAGETEVDEDIKNGIGNLTLLDSETNRSYGDSLFLY